MGADTGANPGSGDACSQATPGSRRFVLGTAIGLVALALLGRPALASEAQLGEEPAPTDVEGMKGGFAPKGVERGIPRLQAFRRRVLPSWLHDSRLDVHLRTYYLEHAEDSDSDLAAEVDRGAWAYGGWLAWQSPWWFGRVSLASAAFTSQRIWGPERKDGTRLLAEGQHGYTVVGLANLQLRYRSDDEVLTLYRHYLDLPFLNRRDNRMTPNTFEGVSAIGTLRHWDYAAGWISRMKERNDDEFRSMAEVAGVVGRDRGLAFVGLRWRPSERFQIGFTDQVVPDVLNTFYAEASYTRELIPELGLRLEAQYTDQRSVGEDLLAGDDFQTFRFGARAALSYRSLGLALAYSWTDRDRGIVSPFGSDPSYLSTMQDDFEKAGDRAALITLSYGFERLGVPELTAALKFAIGENSTAVEGGRGVDRREVETTLDYRISADRLQGLWLRLRGSYLDDGPLESGEIRFIVNYDFPVF